MENRALEAEMDHNCSHVSVSFPFVHNFGFNSRSTSTLINNSHNRYSIEAVVQNLPLHPS